MVRLMFVAVGLALCQAGCQSTIPPEVEKQMQMHSTISDMPKPMAVEQAHGGIQ